MKRVLLTGIAGFAGSHIAEHLCATTDWQIAGLVSLRHMGDSLRLLSLDHSRVAIHYHDLSGPISDRLAEKIGDVDYVVNAAAQSHVERSIDDPVPFVENNVSLALNMLEYARKAKPRAFLQISTDEVYGPAPHGHNHAEWEPIIPSNPYSASKACQEAIATSYWRTYGVPLVLTNCMNLIGERQAPEKFVPMCIRRVFRGERVTIHGNSDVVGSRFYLHARNHADAIRFLLEEVTPSRYPDSDRPDRYNIVGEREVNNLEMAQAIADIIGKPLDYELVDFHSARPGHDLRYALDGSKLAATGWTPPVPLIPSLERTISWTEAHPEWMS